MKRAVFIVQGEGRGHMSQALAFAEHLSGAGWELMKVYLGSAPGRELPTYFREAFGNRLSLFRSPWFAKRPDRKGIRVWRSLFLNLLRAPVFLGERNRLNKEIRKLRPDFVFNFYDVVGALALRKIPEEVCRVGIGHHFTLHLENYPCPKNKKGHEKLLRIHTGIILKSCDRVFALSFRDISERAPLEVIPPLIRKSFMEAEWKGGNRYLVYLLHEGFVSELLRIKSEIPDFNADVFSDLPPQTRLGEGIELHPIDEREFREKMLTCRALICTAGFDTAAEAAYLGVPLVVIPVLNHFEQACNGADLERSGLGISVTELSAAIFEKEIPTADTVFRSWAQQSGPLILKALEDTKHCPGGVSLE